MSSFRYSLVRFLWRLLIAAPFFALSWIVLARAGTTVAGIAAPLVSIVLSMIGAVIVALPLARLVAEPWGGFFFPEHYDRNTSPMYGIPESKRKQGNYQEAIFGFMEIAEKYPTEIKPYIEAMDISFTELNDELQGHAFYEKGLAALPRKQDQDALTRMYEAFRSRLKPDIPMVRPPIPMMPSQPQEPAPTTSQPGADDAGMRP